MEENIPCFRGILYIGDQESCQVANKIGGTAVFNIFNQKKLSNGFRISIKGSYQECWAKKGFEDSWYL